MTVLQTKNLRKTFGEVQAVADVSLDIEAGEIFGFLGPNGAGKTTTIGMILGLIHPTAGSVHVFGEQVTPSHTKPLRSVGALVGAAPALVPYLSARENLQMVKNLHPHVDQSRIDEVLKMVDIHEAADRIAKTFSTGMKQRLGLAMALLHRPKLLILDEPTNGMDPAGMREVRQLLRRLSDDGITIFLSSHLLHEVEQVCDRVAVLNHGEIVTQGTVDTLLNGKQPVVKVRVAQPNEAAALFNKLADVRHTAVEGSQVIIEGISSEHVVGHLTRNGIIPSEVTTSKQNLENLFIKLTE